LLVAGALEEFRMLGYEIDGDEDFGFLGADDDFELVLKGVE